MPLYPVANNQANQSTTGGVRFRMVNDNSDTVPVEVVSEALSARVPARRVGAPLDSRGHRSAHIP